MTLLTWSNLESVRENFGYPADGTVSAILFITGISWQKCLGAHQARMQGLLLQPSWRQRDFNFVFFFSIFYAPTTTDNRWKLLFCHMWLWETGQKDLMVPFEVHYRSKWCSFPTTLTKRLASRGCAARLSKSWTYFRPKNVIFHTRFQTRPKKSDLAVRQNLCHHSLD